MKMRLKFISTMWLLTVSIPVARSEVTPTNEWVNFYGRASKLHGLPVPVGATIDAYDPQGVHCGSFLVKTIGEYGFLVVYRDDPLTTATDEGALPGEVITFKIDGVDARASSPGANVWTTNGAVVNVELETNCEPIVIHPAGDRLFREDTSEVVIADLDTVFSDPDLDVLQYSAHSAVAALQVRIDADHALLIQPEANWNGEGNVIATATDGVFTVQDTVLIAIAAINDPPVICCLADTFFANNASLTLNLSRYALDVEDDASQLKWSIRIEPDKRDSVNARIDDQNHAVFTADHDFAGRIDAIFEVTDTENATDHDTIVVEIDSPTAIGSRGVGPQPPVHILEPNYPNPFNPETRIGFGLPERGKVILHIVNVLGQKVRTLLHGDLEAGWHYASWDGTGDDGRPVPCGVYLLQMKTAAFEGLRKMTLLR